MRDPDSAFSSHDAGKEELFPGEGNDGSYFILKLDLKPKIPIRDVLKYKTTAMSTEKPK